MSGARLGTTDNGQQTTDNGQETREKGLGLCPVKGEG